MTGWMQGLVATSGRKVEEILVLLVERGYCLQEIMKNGRNLLLNGKYMNEEYLSLVIRDCYHVVLAIESMTGIILPDIEMPFCLRGVSFDGTKILMPEQPASENLTVTLRKTVQEATRYAETLQEYLYAKLLEHLSRTGTEIMVQRKEMENDEQSDTDWKTDEESGNPL